ncbi:MAG: PHP domain-containing protein [Nitrospinae bacterium]|nr:PHP domain-containing protein [Nitrospinota bacterium]
MYADLHIHTAYSDGSFLPATIIRRAVKNNLKIISITDHDSVDGIAASIKEGEKNNIEVIPGIEISTTVDTGEIHILGYFIDYTDEYFLKNLKRIQDIRIKRMSVMVDKLKRLMIDIDLNELIEYAASSSIGRLHLAHFLKKKGIVGSAYESFDRYIGSGKPAYEKMNALSPEEGIELISDAGGIPVLAHPGLTKRDDLIDEMIQSGLRGLEVYHSGHSEEDTNRYFQMTKDKGLLITGGSDCHGEKKLNILMGRVKLPIQYMDRLKEADFIGRRLTQKIHD